MQNQFKFLKLLKKKTINQYINRNKLQVYFAGNSFARYHQEVISKKLLGIYINHDGRRKTKY